LLFFWCLRERKLNAVAKQKVYFAILANLVLSGEISAPPTASLRRFPVYE
jgi:hypothetical protein